MAPLFTFAIWILQQAKNSGNGGDDYSSPVGGLPFLFIAFWLVRGLFSGTGSNPGQASQSVDELAAQRRYPEAEKALQKLIRATEKEQGKDGIGVGVYVRRMAQLKAEQGQNDAADELFQRVLDIQERSLGSNSIDLLPTLDWTAHVAMAKGEDDRALAIRQRALRIRSAAAGEDDPGSAWLWNEMGLIMLRKQDGKSAAEYFQRAVGIVDKHGIKTENDLIFLENLAIGQEQSRELALAETHYRRAMELEGQIVGGAAPRMVNLSGLARVLQQTGRNAEAESLYRQALAAVEEADGSDSATVSVMLSELAWVLMREGRPAEAELMFRRAVAIREKMTGGDELQLAEALGGLADAVERQGRMEESVEINRRSLKILEEKAGPKDALTALKVRYIGSQLVELNRFDEAEELFRRALEIGKASEAEGAEGFIAATLFRLAGVLKDKGDLAGAERTYWQSHEKFKESSGPESLDVAITLEALAGVRTAQGNVESPETLLRQVLAIKEKVLKPNDPAIAFTLVGLAMMLQRRGEFGDAEPMLRRALLIYEGSKAPTHVIATTIHFLAGCLYSRAKVDEAESELRRALEMLNRDPETEQDEAASIMGSLAAILERRGDVFGARLLFGEAYNKAAQLLGVEHPTTIEMKAAFNRLLSTAAAAKMN